MEPRQKKVVLVTEDEPAMMRAISDTLDKAGFTVLPAKDGSEGLALAKKDHPDAIILDIVMPKMGGVTMMEDLRRDPWGKGVPIIILTNLDTNSTMISTILKDQPAYYLLKSNTKLEELVDKVKDVVGETA